MARPFSEWNDIGSQGYDAPSPLASFVSRFEDVKLLVGRFQAIQICKLLEVNRASKGRGERIFPFTMPSCMKTPVSPLSPMPMKDVTP